MLLLYSFSQCTVPFQQKYTEIYLESKLLQLIGAGSGVLLVSFDKRHEKMQST